MVRSSGGMLPRKTLCDRFNITKLLHPPKLGGIEQNRLNRSPEYKVRLVFEAKSSDVINVSIIF